MAIPAEHLYESCTCTDGMRNGLRCADCGGRGIVPKGTKPSGAAVEPEGEEAPDDGLEDLSKTHLQSRAKDLGLSSGGTKDALIKAIREATRAVEPEGEEASDEEAAETES